MFRCKGSDDKIYLITWEKIKDAWLAASAVCQMPSRMKVLEDVVRSIPDVSSVELTADGTDVTVTWNSNKYYYTEIQYKINDGDWVTLDLLDPLVSEY